MWNCVSINLVKTLRNYDVSICWSGRIVEWSNFSPTYIYLTLLGSLSTNITSLVLFNPRLTNPKAQDLEALGVSTELRDTPLLRYKHLAQEGGDRQKWENWSAVYNYTKKYWVVWNILKHLKQSENKTNIFKQVLNIVRVEYLS